MVPDASEEMLDAIEATWPKEALVCSVKRQIAALVREVALRNLADAWERRFHVDCLDHDPRLDCANDLRAILDG
jgi:hypothetical protein